MGHIMLEKLLKQPGFIYEINGEYYFLGKWICKKSTDVNANDFVFMYQMCRRSNDEPDTNIYFQKIRACADFALEIPYNPAKIRSDMETLLSGLSEAAKSSLERQMKNFEEDLVKYCG